MQSNNYIGGPNYSRMDSTVNHLNLRNCFYYYLDAYSELAKVHVLNSWMSWSHSPANPSSTFFYYCFFFCQQISRLFLANSNQFGFQIQNVNFVIPPKMTVHPILQTFRLNLMSIMCNLLTIANLFGLLNLCLNSYLIKLSLNLFQMLCYQFIDLSSIYYSLLSYYSNYLLLASLFTFFKSPPKH